MTPASPEGIAFLPTRDPPTGQRYRLSLSRIEQELTRYLSSARVEAEDRFAKLVKDRGPEAQLRYARAELAYLESSRGPAYQTRLLKQLGQRDVDAVITAQQTPLERLREIGAALGARLKSQPPALVQRAVRALEHGTAARSGPDAPVRAGKGEKRNPVPHTTQKSPLPPRDKGRSR